MRGAKCFLESSADGPFFELFNLQNARYGIGHHRRKTCENLQNRGDSRGTGAAPLINVNRNVIQLKETLQVTEIRKSYFDMSSEHRSG